MTARRFAGAVAAGALAWALVIGGAVVACDGPEPRSPEDVARVLDRGGDSDGVGELQDDGSGEYIEEDDPRWDCRTMGNRTCGEGRAA